MGRPKTEDLRDYYKEMLAANSGGSVFKIDNFKTDEIPSWLKLEACAWDKDLLSGWKFHISVPPEDVQKSWNILVDLLLNDGQLHSAKVALPSLAQELFVPEELQVGKMLVVYTSQSIDPGHYKKLLQELEGRLRENGICSGLNIKGDRKVPGSDYIWYRNAMDQDKKYLSAEWNAQNKEIDEAEKYNPHGQPDPYLDFTIDGLRRNQSVSSLPDFLYLPRLGFWEYSYDSTKKLTAHLHDDSDEEKRESLLKDLQSNGYHPKVKKDKDQNYVISVNGNDAIRLIRAQERLSNKLGIGSWEEAEDAKGKIISRVPVRSVGHAKEVVAILNKFGVYSKIAESKTLELTVRVLLRWDVEEIAYLQNIREKNKEVLTNPPKQQQRKRYRVSHNPKIG